MATILASALAGWLTDRRGERPMILSGFVLKAVGLLVLVRASALPGFAVAMITFGLGVGCLMPAYDSLIAEVVPEERRGLAYGLFGTALGLLSLPFRWIGGQLWERVSPQAPFWITAGACLILVPIVWAKFAVPGDSPLAGAELADAGH